MEGIRLNHPRLRVFVRTGAEGPREDPYHFEEVHVQTQKNRVVLHQGLGTWLTINGQKLNRNADEEYEDFEARLVDLVFPHHVGFTLAQLERISRKLTDRCKKCGGKRFEWFAGFPGEHLKGCSQCHHIVDSWFDRSAIE